MVDSPTLSANEQKNDTIVSRIVSKLSQFKLVVLLVLLLSLAIAISSHQKNVTESIDEELPPIIFEPEDLLVLNAQPDNKKDPTLFKFVFNHPVDAHHLQAHTSIEPPIPGSWHIDASNNKIAEYRFDEKLTIYPYTFIVQKGLVSANDKELTQDYILQFRKILANNPGPYARVSAVVYGEPIQLYNYAENVKIYRSNLAQLLNFLVYTLPDNSVRGRVYDGNYSNKEMQHDESVEIKDYTVNGDSQIEQLEPGIYYIENNYQDPYFIVVNTIGAVLRQDDKRVFLGIFDIADGSAIEDGVLIRLYNFKQGAYVLGEYTHTKNNNSFPFAYPAKLDAVVGEYNGEVFFVPVEMPTSRAEIQVSSDLDEAYRLFVYTDRPIYKPGDTVFVRGIVRKDSDSLYSTPPQNTKIAVTLPGSGPGKEMSSTLETDEYGTFYTHFVLPSDYTPTETWIKAAMAMNNNELYIDTAPIEVLNFKKAEFQIKTSVAQKEYLANDTVVFTVSGNYFNGKPLAGKEVTYTVSSKDYYEVEKAVYNENFNITSQGGMCGGGIYEDYYGRAYEKGAITLDANGEATITTTPPADTGGSQTLTLLVTGIDVHQNKILSAANTIVHEAEFNVFFVPSASRYAPDETVAVPFYAEYQNGDALAGHEFTYRLTEYDYDGYSNDPTARRGLISGSVETDADGKAILSFRMLGDNLQNSHILKIESTDSLGNTVQKERILQVLNTENSAKSGDYSPWGQLTSQTYLKITSAQNSFTVGESINLTVRSPADIDALVTLERGRVYEPQMVHLAEGENTLSIPVSDQLSPSITIVFSFFHNGNYYSEGLSLNIPAMHKLLTVETTLNKDSYSPSDTAELLIRTTDENGTPVPAQLSVGVVDKAIYALRKSATPAIHSSFYFFRARRTNASSSLTRMGDWGGRGGGGGGGSASPDGSVADILYWNPIVRTDASGEARLQIPLLGHETIWKVVTVGSTEDSLVGQTDTEFIVGSDVKGAESMRRPWSLW